MCRVGFWKLFLKIWNRQTSGWCTAYRFLENSSKTRVHVFTPTSVNDKFTVHVARQMYGYGNAWEPKSPRSELNFWSIQTPLFHIFKATLIGSFYRNRVVLTLIMWSSFWPKIMWFLLFQVLSACFFIVIEIQKNFTEVFFTKNWIFISKKRIFSGKRGFFSGKRGFFRKKEDFLG